MKTAVIRWVDRAIGRPICLALTLHRRFCCIFRKEIADYTKPSRILFIKLVEQGSTVLAYPALKKAASMVGRERLYFLVFKENRHILDILDVLPPENIIEIDSKGFLNFIFSSIRALIRIRRQGIDTVVDMEFFSRGPAILSYLSGAKIRVGFHLFTCEGPYRGDLFTHRLMYNPYLHMRILFASLVEALNHKAPSENMPMAFKVPDVPDDMPRFLPTGKEKQSLIEKIERVKKSALGRPIILLNPDIGDLLMVRRWPEENYIKLARIILKEFPQATIIITGTKEEDGRSGAMAAEIGNAVSLAGQTSLRELLTLYCISDVLVTSDSGPGHFSVLTPIRSVILFGPETARLYGEEVPDKISVASDLICSPCVNVYNHRKPPCEAGTCLNQIKPESVLTKLKPFLKSTLHLR